MKIFASLPIKARCYITSGSHSYPTTSRQRALDIPPEHHGARITQPASEMLSAGSSWMQRPVDAPLGCLHRHRLLETPTLDILVHGAEQVGSSKCTPGQRHIPLAEASGHTLRLHAAEHYIQQVPRFAPGHRFSTWW